MCDVRWRVERDSWFTAQCSSYYGGPGAGSFSEFIYVGDLPCDGLAPEGGARISVSGSLGSAADGNYLEARLLLPDGTRFRAFPRVEGSCGDFSVSIDLSDDEFRQFCSSSYIRIVGNYLMSGDCVNCSLWGGWRNWSARVTLDLPGPGADQDSDLDGVLNKWDRCPLAPGDPSCGDGCPRNACGLCGVFGVGDQNGDGVIECIDSDHDGVPDWRDRCPKIAGDIACGGCPSDVCGSLRTLEVQEWLEAWALFPYGCPEGPVQFNSASIRSGAGGALAVSDVTVTLSTNLAVRPGESVGGWFDDASGSRLFALPQVGAHPMCEFGLATTIIPAEVFNRLLIAPWHSSTFSGTSSWDSDGCYRFECSPSAVVQFRFTARDLPPAGSDLDQDGVAIELDNCPHLANADQRDCDGDGIGDRCAIAWGAEDLDGGGVPDRCQIAYGDVDLNSVVDFADVALMLLYFDEVDPPLGDMDGDRFVTTADIAVVLLNFGPVPF